MNDFCEELAAVLGDRREEHGDPTETFEIIADFWAVYDKWMDIKGHPKDALSVTDKMILFKIGRSLQNRLKLDTRLDEGGYSGCGYQIAQTMARLEKPLGE